MTNRPFHKDAMVATFKIVWRLAKEVNVLMLDSYRFLLKFSTEGDKIRVCEGSPWCFNKHLLIVQNYDAGLRPRDYWFELA